MDQFNHDVCSFAARLQTFALETDIANQDQLFTVRMNEKHICTMTGREWKSHTMTGESFSGAIR